MNREIKFRIWDTIDKKFELLNIAWNDCIGTSFVSLYNYPNRRIYQQFTNLKDKNGKNIYEGDLVNFHINGHTHGRDPDDEKNMEVWFDPKYAHFSFGREPSDWCLLDDLSDFEVVGNIFENADLLKT